MPADLHSEFFAQYQKFLERHAACGIDGSSGGVPLSEIVPGLPAEAPGAWCHRIGLPHLRAPQIIVTARCPVCGETETFHLDARDTMRLLNGEFSRTAAAEAAVNLRAALPRGVH
jgi:hypothetical protein